MNSASSLRVVFMGTPDFALPTLNALHQSTHIDIVGVFSAPIRAQGRGRKPTKSAIHTQAEALSLPIYGFHNLHDSSVTLTLSQLQADIGVVVAFRRLPEAVWKAFPMGCVNLHASLLPYYRGAAPIPWAIIKGEEYTGITTFLIDKRIDTGQILLQKRLAIEKEDTYDTLADRMKHMGAKLILETLTGLKTGTLHPTPQPHIPSLPLAPKIHPQDTYIDWNMSAQCIERRIRAFHRTPSAWTYLRINAQKRKRVKIHQAKVQTLSLALKPEEILRERHKMYIGTSSPEALEVLSLQVEGKRAMHTKDFLQGMKREVSLSIDSTK